MDESTLLLEVGSQALNDLTTDEKSAILAKYSSSQVKLAGMKTFELLMKKFKANYRMGKLYEDLSDKYEVYRQIFNKYARETKAGSVQDNPSDTLKVDRYKWPGQRT